jgi:hypothetical protein
MKKTIPHEFRNVQLCRAMGIDYWTLMFQPKRHVELFEMYLTVEGKIQEENIKRQKSASTKARASKGSRRGR